MATLAGALGILTLVGGVCALVAGDRMLAVDFLVVAGLAGAVWGATRGRAEPPPE